MLIRRWTLQCIYDDWQLKHVPTPQNLSIFCFLALLPEDVYEEYSLIITRLTLLHTRRVSGVDTDNLPPRRLCCPFTAVITFVSFLQLLIHNKLGYISSRRRIQIAVSAIKTVKRATP